MKKRIILNKLRSQTGASISFALLLFLVCAVLCSVIITAATASSGRMAGIAESDQRYNSVTSASELLKALLDGKTVSVVKVTESWSTTTYTEDMPGSPAENMDGNTSKPPEEAVYLIADKSASEITDAVLENASVVTPATLYENIQNDAAYSYFDKFINKTGTANLPNRTLSLTSDLGTENGPDPLGVTIEEKMAENGDIQFTVYNTNGDNKFKQEVLFGATVVTEDNILTEEGTPQNYNGAYNSYTITTKTTETEIASLTWTMNSIQTVSESP